MELVSKPPMIQFGSRSVEYQHACERGQTVLNKPVKSRKYQLPATMSKSHNLTHIELVELCMDLRGLRLVFMLTTEAR